jgi:DNA invertase Pin-like site-specific DNA recombinase
VAGIEYARTHGTKSGRAIGRPKAVFDRARVIELRDSGQSWRQISAALGVAVRTLRRVYSSGVAKHPVISNSAPRGILQPHAG